MIILIGGEKGGTGKTTLSINLAVQRILAGGDVQIMDTDKQGNASAWGDVRANTCKKYPDKYPQLSIIQKFGSQVAYELRNQNKKYKDIIVDAGGRDSAELRSAMAVANKLIIPIKPSQFDTWTLPKMNSLITEVKEELNPKLETILVINMANPNPKILTIGKLKEFIHSAKEKAREEDEPFHFEVPSIVIYERNAFSNSIFSGLAVMELKRKDKQAIDELNLLYNEVFHD
jgi:chromosome partitioning protein